MSHWNRRSVLATGAALTAGGLLSTAGVTGAEDEGSTDGLEEPDGWSSYRGGPGNDGYLPIDGEFEEPDTVAWEYEETGALAVVDGTVYLNADDEIHALDDVDGAVEWTTDVDGAMGAPAVAGGTLYVGGDRLTALEADSGDVEWTTDLAAESTTVAHGRVLALVDGAVYALEADDGEVDWDRETVEMETDDGSGPEVHAVASVVASDGLVHARTASTESDVNGLAAFDPETGGTAWTWLPTEDSDAPDEEFGGLVARDGRVYAVVDASAGGGGYILDAASGERLHGGTSEFTPAVGDEAWIATGDTGFGAREPDGERLWSVSGATLQWSSASIVGETVVVIKAGRGPDSSTELVGFDVETGDERWTVGMEFDDRETGGIGVGPVVTEDTVYVLPERNASSDGVLVALRASGPDPGDGDDPEDGGGDDPKDGGGDDPKDGSNDDPKDGSGDEDCDCEDGDGDGGGEVGPDEGDGRNGDADDGNGDSDDNDGTGGIGDDDGGSGGEEGDTGSEEDVTDPDEGMPGFTTGAGLLGGAATLEWLRRKAGAGESGGVDGPAE